MAACAQQAFTPAVIEKEKKVYIDQDLHVYCQDCDLFYCVFLFGLNCFSVSCQQRQETWCKYFHSPLHFILLCA